MSADGSGPHYALRCAGCGRETPDDGLTTACRECGDSALLRTRYADRAFPVGPEVSAASGIFRYARWLPVRREVPGSCLPAVHRSEGLAAALGLTDLWISFSGYWPEMGCHMETGTFKELEAYTVLARIPENAGTLVVASAGNTAAAFASACRRSGTRCLLVVPEFALRALEFGAPGEGWGRAVRVLGLPGATYNDAITYAARLVASSPAYVGEGGVRNVGRRDGLAVIALAAYEAMGRLPDVYVQAVGSGAGALGVHEAATRILAAAPGGRLPRLLLCQNAARAPLRDAWHGTRDGRTGGAPSPPAPDPASYAPELLNSAPPFATAGGVREALRASGGTVLVADEDAARRAAALFEEREGIDIEPPAAVAVACLREAVRTGRIAPRARILLNVTGGGRERLRRERLRRAPRVRATATGRAREPEGGTGGKGGPPVAGSGAGVRSWGSPR
ncbi:cysteate synthase [Streptomyces albiaxialis]|uniref:Cysteate synthase n=1 Tax=Streptomyces albiaxialis TaxID=329523 RepID=A0ABN2WRQ6_9ACTN